MPNNHSTRKINTTEIKPDAIVDAKGLALLFNLQPVDLRKSPLKDILTDTKATQTSYNLLPAIAVLVEHLVKSRVPDSDNALDTIEGIKLKTARLDYEKKLREQQLADGHLLVRGEAQISWSKILGQVLQAHHDFFTEVIEEVNAPPDVKHELSVKNANFRNNLASENWATGLMLDDTEAVETGGDDVHG